MPGRAEVRPFPWDEAMAAGLGLLRLEPRAFWAMTPKELDAALRVLIGPRMDPAPLDRGDLAHLMQMFPDQ